MDYAVKLAKLPSDFAFPERLQDRARYDAQRGELIYSGFMTKCTYDELSALSDDPDYHRALERLFVETSAAVSPEASKRLPTAAIAAAIGGVALAAGAVWMATRHAAPENPPQQVIAVSATAR